MAVVGFNQTVYSATEEDVEVWVCVVVDLVNPNYPNESCPVASAFDVLLSTVDDTAGR